MYMDCAGLSTVHRWTSQVQRLMEAVIKRASACKGSMPRVEGLPASVIKAMIQRVTEDVRLPWETNLSDHRTLATVVLQYYTLGR